MSGEYLHWARTTDAPISPLARLALLGLADSAHEYGLTFNPLVLAALWTHVGVEGNTNALTELERFSLAYVADQDDIGLASVAFIAVSDWEIGYDRWIRNPFLPGLSLPNTRSHLPPYPPVPLRIRRLVFERDGWRCVLCGSDHRLTIDHVHPRSRGGTNTPANLQALCAACNSAKSNRLTVDGRAEHM